jgi:hypothetical protein
LRAGGDGDLWLKGRIRMRYLDYALAWIIFLCAVSFMITIEIWHLRGAILDIPFLWLVVAMLNFLRLRNEGRNVAGLRTTSIAANVVASMLEIVRWRLFGPEVFKAWGPFPRIATIAFLGAAILSMVRKNDSGSPARF